MRVLSLFLDILLRIQTELLRVIQKVGESRLLPRIGIERLLLSGYPVSRGSGMAAMVFPAALLGWLFLRL